MSADNRTKEELEAGIKQGLIKNGMPPELAGRAVSSWMYLIENSPALFVMLESSDERSGSPGWWAQYCFMQGFVAGNMAAVHHN